jgi:hypothetical protein
MNKIIQQSVAESIQAITLAARDKRQVCFAMGGHVILIPLIAAGVIESL